MDDSDNEAISVALPSQSVDAESEPLLVQLQKVMWMKCITRCVLDINSCCLSSVTKDLLNFDQCIDPTVRCFGPFRVLFSQVFFESALSFALVNLKPIVPGSCYEIYLTVRFNCALG